MWDFCIPLATHLLGTFTWESNSACVKSSLYCSAAVACTFSTCSLPKRNRWQFDSPSQYWSCLGLFSFSRVPHFVYRKTFKVYSESHHFSTIHRDHPHWSHHHPSPGSPKEPPKRSLFYLPVLLQIFCTQQQRILHVSSRHFSEPHLTQRKSQVTQSNMTCSCDPLSASSRPALLLCHSPETPWPPHCSSDFFCTLPLTGSA